MAGIWPIRQSQGVSTTREHRSRRDIRYFLPPFCPFPPPFSAPPGRLCVPVSDPLRPAYEMAPPSEAKFLAEKFHGQFPTMDKAILLDFISLYYVYYIHILEDNSFDSTMSILIYYVFKN